MAPISLSQVPTLVILIRTIPEWSLLSDSCGGRKSGPLAMMTEFLHSQTFTAVNPPEDRQMLLAQRSQQDRLDIASKLLNFEDWNRMRFYERPIAIDDVNDDM